MSASHDRGALRWTAGANERFGFCMTHAKAYAREHGTVLVEST